MALSAEQKKYRDRANRARRALLKEKREFGTIFDSSGKRYRAPVNFVLSDAPNKAVELIEWLEQELPNDTGEPLALLYAALAYYRTNQPNKAKIYLLDAMLGNVYLLPHLFSKPLPVQDMWHSSNFEEPSYVAEIDEFLQEPSQQERDWVQQQFESELFTAVREKYIATFCALQDTKATASFLNASG